MKKILTGILVSAIMLFTSTAFAEEFDWSQSWCNYGAGLKAKSIIVDFDIGASDMLFTNFRWGAGYWAIPYTEVAIDVAVPIWKLPFSFGGYVGIDSWGNNGKDNFYTSVVIHTGAEVKYHVMMPVENLDLYAGIKMGGVIAIGEYATVPSIFDFNTIIGANYYFSENFGANAEFGVPTWLKVGFSYKF